jgi:hypothetical protein
VAKASRRFAAPPRLNVIDELSDLYGGVDDSIQLDSAARTSGETTLLTAAVARRRRVDRPGSPPQRAPQPGADTDDRAAQADQLL